MITALLLVAGAPFIAGVVLIASWPHDRWRHPLPVQAATS
jgi:hypothetical protein